MNHFGVSYLELQLSLPISMCFTVSHLQFQLANANTGPISVSTILLDNSNRNPNVQTLFSYSANARGAWLRATLASGHLTRILGEQRRRNHGRGASETEKTPTQHKTPSHTREVAWFGLGWARPGAPHSKLFSELCFRASLD